MLVWNGSAASDANFNSTFEAEAIVTSAVAAQTGSIFPSVTTALAAGKRDILVVPGSYSESPVINVANVRVRGGRPAGYDSGFSGCRFSGQWTIQASCVSIEDIQSVGSTAYGFRVDNGCSSVHLIRCHAYQSAYQGFYLNYLNTGASFLYATYDNLLHECVAEDCGGTTYSGFYVLDHASHNYEMEWMLQRCTSNSPGLHGFEIFSNGVVLTAASRLVMLHGCRASGAPQNGVKVGKVNPSGGCYGQVQVVGGTFTSNTGSGFYIATPSVAASRYSITGARFHGNGFGVAMEAASAQLAINGNTFSASGSAHLSNCNLCPGVEKTVAIGAFGGGHPTAPYTLPGTNVIV